MESQARSAGLFLSIQVDPGSHTASGLFLLLLANQLVRKLKLDIRLMCVLAFACDVCVRPHVCERQRERGRDLLPMPPVKVHCRAQ